MLVQGGEPLLRGDLQEILEDFSAIGVHLTLIANGRTGWGTVIGQTMSIILKNSTVPIAPTVPAAGEIARTGGAFLPLRARKPIEVSTFLEWPDIIGQGVVRYRARSCRPGATRGVVRGKRT